MNFQQKPTLVHVIAWMTLASGIVNLFWGVAASHTALATVVGVVCVPFTILPTILGIFEVMYAAKLFSDPPQITVPSTNIAILQILCVLVGNVFSMAVGILSLVFYNDTIVRNYFASLNETLATSAVVPLPEAREEKPGTGEPLSSEAEERPAE